MSRPLVTLAVAAAVLALGTGCSRDDSDDAAPTEGSSTNSSTDTSTDTDASPLTGPVVPLTADEICASLPQEAVGEALGVEVIESAATSGQATPQCAYTYRAADGNLNNATVAALRPEDLGGRSTLAEGYDYTLQVNKAISKDVEDVAAEAGDRSVVLDGPAIDLGVLAAGGHLITVIVADDAIPVETAVELLDVVAEHLGG